MAVIKAVLNNPKAFKKLSEQSVKMQKAQKKPVNFGAKCSLPIPSSYIFYSQIIDLHYLRKISGPQDV
jgi:hypothetical protein